MPKYLTKKQKQKADKVMKLLKELSDENVTFYMNSMPDLELGFLRNGRDIDTPDDFFNFLNYSENKDMFYAPLQDLKLDCYGA